jgi:hypothetical protein
MMCITTRLNLADMAMGGVGIMRGSPNEKNRTKAEIMMKMRSGLAVANLK